MEATPWLAELVERCTLGGLDLIRPFDLALFHAEAAEEHHLQSFGRSHPLAVVVGHTRALWPAFLAALRDRPERRTAAHPLDDYVEETIRQALEHVSLPHTIHWGHRSEPVIALQRIAAAAGLAELGPAHLSVHPVHGPWIGLRAVIVFDVDAAEPVVEPPPRFSHCATCSRPCVPALERALAVTERAGDTSHQAWIDVRDACPVGRASRYGALQLRYHYTKDRSALGEEPSDPAPNDD